MILYIPVHTCTYRGTLYFPVLYFFSTSQTLSFFTNVVAKLN